MTDTLTTYAAAPLATLDSLAEQAHAYAEQSRSANTRRAYSSDWAHFAAWAADRLLAALPAEPGTLVLYLTDCAATLAVATLTRRLAAISQAHQLAVHSSPTRNETVRSVLKGIRRTHGTAQRQASAATTPVLKAMVAALPDTKSGLRDRALLLVGFAGALRRSELVALDVADVQLVSEGAIITVQRSKTDQEGAGREIGIPWGQSADTCPVRALSAWLQAASIAEGPLFRPINRHGGVQAARLTGSAVAEVVKRAALAAGFDAAQFSGHSLRAGLATSAAAAGASEAEIMSQTGHKSSRVLRGYIRRATLFQGNAAAKVGL